MMLCEKYKEQFLQPEVRCDTYIGIEIKQVWFAELQLLEKFIDVCNKHGLSYQLVGGSLLGAIRHKGFIPWDDDVDVGMLRPDYDRFVQLAKNELEAPFFLQTPLTDPGRNIDYVQIRNSATTAIDLRYVDDHNTFNQGIFIDIFVLDGVNENSSKMKKQESKINFIKKLMYIKVLQTSRFKLVNKLSSFIPWKMLALFYDRALKMSKVENSSKIANLGLGFDFGKSVTIRDKTFYDECIFMPFEMLNVPVPKRYDEWLTLRYGNYMKPSKAGAIHSGIFFDTEKSYKEYTE